MSSVVIAGNTSGSVTLSAPDVAGTTTITLPSTSGTMATTTALGGGATSTTSSTDITLTSSSNKVQNVSMTATDKSVILPAATTITSLGGPIFVISNSGVFPFYVKNSSGFTLVVLPSNSVVYLSLSNNSTAAGVWFSEDANYYVGLSSFQTITSSYVRTGNYASFANAMANGVTSSKISSTSALVTWQQGTSGRDIYGAVVSYSGNTISVGTATLIYSGSSTASFNNQCLMLDATNGFIFVSRASNCVAVPVTVSGTTITVGTASSTFASTTVVDTGTPISSTIAMTSTIATIAYRNSASTNTYSIATITHNGASAPTVGTASSSITVSQFYSGPALAKIDATTLAAVYPNVTTNIPVTRIITISGSSAPTLGTANTSASLQITNDSIGYTIFVKSSSEFIVISGYASFNYTFSGTTVTYVGYINTSTYAKEVQSGYYMAAMTLPMGDYILDTSYWSGVGLGVYKVVGSYSYVQAVVYPNEKYLTWNQSVATSSIVGLDSTTALVFTNDYSSTTIYGSIVKIL